MKVLTKENLTRIGFVNKVSGFNGSVSCIMDEGRADKLLDKKFFFLILEGLPVPFLIESIEQKGNELIVKFEDIDSEAQAKKIIRKEIYSEKLRIRKKEEIISWKDLEGYKAIDNKLGEIGMILEVNEYPMQMIAKCLIGGREVLFPLNEDIVIEIDSDEKKIFIELPEGLLDVYLK